MSNYIVFSYVTTGAEQDIGTIAVPSTSEFNKVLGDLTGFIEGYTILEPLVYAAEHPTASIDDIMTIYFPSTPWTADAIKAAKEGRLEPGSYPESRFTVHLHYNG